MADKSSAEERASIPSTSAVHHGSAGLEADVLMSDGDQSDEKLDLASLTPSVIDYEYENGRRYHAYKAGSYPLPNDETELDRLDLQHHVVKLLLNGEIHLAPLENPTQILDLGTGTGLWAIEMADRFPTAVITGVDLSPVQPTSVPKNVIFEVDDIESEWLYPEHYFDHIHCRTMIGSVSDWQRMIKRAFKHCKPGGYLEIQELDPRLASDDGSVARSPFHNELLQSIVEASTKYDKQVPVPSDFKIWLKEAGFVDIKEYLYKIPINSWPKDPHLKEVGKWQCLNYTEGYEAISIGLLTRVLGWTHLEFSVFMAKVRKELADKSIHTYQYFVVTAGRKPYPHEISAAKYASTDLEADTEVETERERPYISSITDGPLDNAEMPVLAEHAAVFKSARVGSSSFASFIDDDESDDLYEIRRPHYIHGNLSNARESSSRSAGSGDLVNGYFVATTTGKPNEFPTRPPPRNAF